MGSRLTMATGRQNNYQGAGGGPGGGPLLIKHGNDIVWAQWYTGHTSAVSSAPWDGFVFDARVPNATHHKVMSTVNVPLADIQADLSGMAAAKASFGTCNKYFCRTVMDNNPPSWWNDTHWTTINTNMSRLAQAALAEGCYGIAWDPEWYDNTTGGPWDWGSTGFGIGASPSVPGSFGDSGSVNPNVAATYGADVGHTLQESRDKAQLRGKAMMDAMLAQWPTLKILAFHGPYDSSTLTAAGVGANYNDVAFANELLGSFEAGMIQSIAAAGYQAQFIDGGEMYTLRTQNDFYKANLWRQYGLKTSASTVMDAAAKAAYNVVDAFAIEDLDIIPGGLPPLTTTVWQNLITWSMRAAPYTWLYTEQWDWWGSGLVAPTSAPPTAWSNAAINGRNAGRL
jgi:hypothetical protein